MWDEHFQRTVKQELKLIREALWRIERKEDVMAFVLQADLDELIKQTAATTDAEDAAATLLQKLFEGQAALQAKLDQAIANDDPVAIAAAQKAIQNANAMLKAKTDALAAAIVANTPATAPPVPPTPPVGGTGPAPTGGTPNPNTSALPPT